MCQCLPIHLLLVHQIQFPVSPGMTENIDTVGRQRYLGDKRLEKYMLADHTIFSCLLPPGYPLD